MERVLATRCISIVLPTCPGEREGVLGVIIGLWPVTPYIGARIMALTTNGCIFQKVYRAEKRFFHEVVKLYGVE